MLTTKATEQVSAFTTFAQTAHLVVIPCPQVDHDVLQAHKGKVKLDKALRIKLSGCLASFCELSETYPHLVPEEEHDRAGIVQFVHCVEIRHF